MFFYNGLDFIWLFWLYILIFDDFWVLIYGLIMICFILMLYGNERVINMGGLMKDFLRNFFCCFEKFLEIRFFILCLFMDILL